MSKRIYPVEHKGRMLMYTDWMNLTEEEEFITAIWETSNYLVERGEKDLLEVIDLRGAFFSLDIFTELKKAAAVTRPFNKKKAVVGDFSESRLLMLKFLNSFSRDKIVAFNGLEEAKDWLIKDL